MVSVPGASSASVPLWLLGVESGRGDRNERGLAWPGCLLALQLSGGEDTKRFGVREAKRCAGQFQSKHSFSFILRGLVQLPLILK